MRSCLTLLLLTVGCAPPPAVVVAGSDTAGDLQPGLQIVFPSAEMLDNPIPMNSDCVLELVIAIDVDNFEIIAPSETDGDKDGQGHWHLQMTVPDRSYTAVFGQAGIINEADLSPGEQVTVRGALQSNTHEELDAFDNYQSVIEFFVGAPEDTGVICP